jgi:hypothetical protein
MGMQLVPLDPTLSRGLNFDYMNQVLAWQTLQELLTTLRPIVGAYAHVPHAVWHVSRSTLFYVCSSLSRCRQRLRTCRPGNAPADDDSLQTGHMLAPDWLAAESDDAAATARGLPCQGDGQRACAICNATPANSPHLSACAHVFCYVCLRTAQAHDKTRAVCPRCSTALASCKRLVPDVPATP